VLIKALKQNTAGSRGHLKTLSIYGFTLAFNAALSFGTFSILTHHLDQADYGVINLYSSLCLFLAPFIAVGVQQNITVDYFKLDAPAFRQRVVNALAIPVLSCVVFSLLFLGLNFLVRELVNVNFLFAVTIPLACFLTVMADVFLVLARNKGRHVLYTGFSLFKTLLESGLTLLLVMALGFRWEGRLGGSLLTLVLAGLFIFYYLRQWRYHTGKLNRQEMGESITRGLPFIPERLAIFVLAGSDRFFIDHFNGVAEVGLYSAGAQLALIVNLATSTLNTTFYPVLYRQLAGTHPDYDQVKKVTWTFLGMAALVMTAVLLSIPLFFSYFIGPLFQEGQVYAVYLTVGLFFWAVYNAFLPYLLVLQKNRLVMYISIAGMGLSLLTNWFSVNYFGALGATYTAILVYFVMAALTIYYAHRFHNLRKLFRNNGLTRVESLP
jgi:O-antigen/teichoic acid export membrane protein